MSVELVNGFVLLPHAPDWNVKPQFRREWNSKVTDAVTGAEDRLSFRHAPLRGIEFQITPFTLEESQKLLGRLLSAKKAGWVVVPLWGRGSVLASPASGASVTLASDDAWSWAVADFAFFSNLEPTDPDAYEVRQVNAVAGAVLNLDQPLARTYRRFCWPVLLGRFRCDDLRLITSHHGSVRISVLERDILPEPNSDLCAIILAADGGGDNFDCYADPRAQPRIHSAVVMRFIVSKHGRSRFWAVRDEAGELVCVCVYKRGALEVARRLAAEVAPDVGCLRETPPEQPPFAPPHPTE